jgi:hypothetical protein
MFPLSHWQKILLILLALNILLSLAELDCDLVRRASYHSRSPLLAPLAMCALPRSPLSEGNTERISMQGTAEHKLPSNPLVSVDIASASIRKASFVMIAQKKHVSKSRIAYCTARRKHAHKTGRREAPHANLTSYTESESGLRPEIIPRGPHVRPVRRPASHLADLQLVHGPRAKI